MMPRSPVRRVWLYVAGALLFAIPFIAVLAPLLKPAGEPAADFTLRDQLNRPFTLSAQRGSAVVLFFGYTACRDVCPATMASLASAYRRAGAPAGVRVVFITVDPARDSPPALARYLARFNPDFEGLTGNRSDLARVYRHYGVYAKADMPAAGTSDYEVTHTTAVYFIDKRGRIRERLEWNATQAEFARALHDAMA